MADAKVTNQGENTPEYVAYILMTEILNNEGKYNEDRSRKEMLNTYIQCLNAVKNGIYRE